MAKILILYANDHHRSLAMLEMESKEINRLLDRVPHKNYSIKLLPAVEPQELIDELVHNGHDLEILHYSGHAHSRNLLFSEREVRGKTLAERLRKCPNLKFVFLNGCATYGQIAFFHEAGIPYVLATSRKVEDTKAYWVASQFYQHLTLGRDVEEAFDSVRKDAGFLEKDIDMGVSRHLGISGAVQEESASLAWGLYRKEPAIPYHLPLQKYHIREKQMVEHGHFLSQLLLV